MTSHGRAPGNLRTATAVAALIAATSLAGCADEGSDGGDDAGGSAVEYGASKQEYVEGLADMEPVELVMQSTAPKGAPTGRRFEDYAAAVEEYSDGKITFEIAYSNAIAPPDQVDDAIADTRIDIGSVLPTLEPSKFPVANTLWDLSFLGRQTPVDGLLQWHGLMIEAAAKSDEIYQEYEDNGLKLLVPTFGSGSYFVDCADPGTDQGSLDGRAIATQSRIQNSQAEALGMSPATVNYAEMFESLERGVVDCAMSTMTVSSLGGFIPAAPHFAFDPDTGIAAPGGSIAIGLERWNSLPLAAQQLLYDRLDVLLTANFEATWENVDVALATIDDEGGSVDELAPDAVEALGQANDEALEEARGSAALGDGEAFVDTLLDSSDQWSQQVEDLGIEGLTVDYDGFREWFAGGTPDLQPYFDALWSGALGERRPS